MALGSSLPSPTYAFSIRIDLLLHYRQASLIQRCFMSCATTTLVELIILRKDQDLFLLESDVSSRHDGREDRGQRLGGRPWSVPCGSKIDLMKAMELFIKSHPPGLIHQGQPKYKACKYLLSFRDLLGHPGTVAKRTMMKEKQILAKPGFLFPMRFGPHGTKPHVTTWSSEHRRNHRSSPGPPGSLFSSLRA